MAKLTAPLLSLGATGKLASTLVFSTWKGLKTARQYVVPANPRTAAQLVQRGLFSAVVDFWRTSMVFQAIRDGWDKAASVSGKPQSGFNAFVSSSLTLSAIDPDASYCVQLNGGSGGLITSILENLDDGGVADEVGDFEVWGGVKASSLSLDGTGDLSGGQLNIVINPDFYDVARYYQIRKDGFDRSGIQLLTVIA